jgi:tetratricopeptide (TPR) repeat protein
MAGRIEDQLGREALVDTIETGPMAFIETYNSVAEEGMELRFAAPENESESVYQNLRSAALKGDLSRVRENLEFIQANPAPNLDVEVAGYLIYSAGQILLKKGHLDLAEAIFQLDSDLFPQVGSIYVGLGDVYAQRGDIPAAIASYERAMELDPRNQWVAVIIQGLE